ncbi:MAG: transglycosylase SLT domain-containing protein [Synergistales bacterium]|nr:transglycosylase SLT domain-containing protein [Synergistales bacterium]
MLWTDMKKSKVRPLLLCVCLFCLFGTPLAGQAEGYVKVFGYSHAYDYMQDHRAKREYPRRVRVMADYFKKVNPDLSDAICVDYAALVERHSRRFEVDPFLAAAIIVKESGVQPRVRNGYSYGLMQVNWKANKGWIPDTFHMVYSARRLVKSRYNIPVGIYILRKALDNSGGNVDRALDRYRGKNIVSYRRKVLDYYRDMVRMFKRE